MPDPAYQSKQIDTFFFFSKRPRFDHSRTVHVAQVHSSIIIMSDPFTPYAHLYTNPTGPGDSRPTALQVVKDDGLEGQWAGKVALITGGTSGIGIETVAALHATGADVYFTSRDEKKGLKTRDSILSRTTGKGKLEIIRMDLESLESVRQAATDFLQRSSTLNVLINNAGKYIQNPPFSSA